MTYFRFHALFNLPLLILLALLGRGEGWTSGAVTALALVVLAALVFTIPWDNDAARRGIWGFPREKYTLQIGWLPVEEYLFFILQTVIVILGVRALLHLVPAWHRDGAAVPLWLAGLCLIISMPIWLVIAWQLRAWRRRQGPRVAYAIHLAWFLPVLYSQWLIGAGFLGTHAGLLALVTTAFGLYYTAADYLAVRAGLWFFDEVQITGWKLARILPWEEIAFFFLTSLLVAQSYLLLLPAGER